MRDVFSLIDHELEAIDLKLTESFFPEQVEYVKTFGKRQGMKTLRDAFESLAFALSKNESEED